ncbi:MAG: hypothetical protein ACI9TH_000976 [Kiritimatiellia bacterium]|jgi:hypothetical protein
MMNGLIKPVLLLALLGLSVRAAPELIPQRMVPIEHREGDHPGREVALRICQTCHLFPEPDLLTKDFWNYYILDEMGLRLGMTPGPEFKGKAHVEMLKDKGMTKVLEKITALGMYPSEPQLTTNDWAAIRAFYLDEAPDRLPPLARPLRLFNGLSQFSVVDPGLHLDGPMVSLLQIDNTRRQIRLLDVRAQRLFVVNGHDGQMTNIQIPPLVQLEAMEHGYRGLVIGSIFPDDRELGKLVAMNEENGNYRVQTLIDHLARPADLAWGDIDGDGIDDVVVCEFGFKLGRLAWYGKDATGAYIRHEIQPREGYLECELLDVDKDGDLDILAAAGQGREGAFIYYNRGDGEFDESYVIQLPPAYGTSGMKIRDVNDDGFFDIILTSGDVGDFYGSFLPKPYQGLRIYTNDGQNHFKEAFHYPMYGTYNVQAEDFDADGDLDFLVGSFFADYLAAPDESVVYLENLGDLVFIAAKLPESVLGRWLLSAAGDVDGDGDIDVALGSFTPGPTVPPAASAQRWSKNSPAFLLLLNRQVKPSR